MPYTFSCHIICLNSIGHGWRRQVRWQLSFTPLPSLAWYCPRYNLGETMCIYYTTSLLHITTNSCIWRLHASNQIHTTTYNHKYTSLTFLTYCCSTTWFQLTITHTYQAKVEEKQHFGTSIWSWFIVEPSSISFLCFLSSQGCENQEPILIYNKNV